MKSIVITGSSSGIGKATSKYFAEQGWKVAVTMRKPENETELNQTDGISLYALDVTDEASVTDGKRQLRYLIGEDAQQTYAMRQQVGDAALVAGMKQRMFA